MASPFSKARLIEGSMLVIFTFTYSPYETACTCLRKICEMAWLFCKPVNAILIYFSHGWKVYASLWYHLGRYQVSGGKSDTYSVEIYNAGLHHDLARLARSSHCFSRCPFALQRAVRLFGCSFNCRKLFKPKYPADPTRSIDFVSL